VLLKALRRPVATTCRRSLPQQARQRHRRTVRQ
jgi:hypothetical protein